MTSSLVIKWKLFLLFVINILGKGPLTISALEFSIPEWPHRNLASLAN